MKMKTKFILVAIFSTILTLNINVFADSFVSPEPSKIELENGKKNFYMTPPSFNGDEYLPSGLYINNTIPEVVYLISSHHTVNDISYFNENNVFLSEDGMYFAYVPTPLFDNRHTSAPPETVLEFYANGNLIQRYNVSQLVKNERKLSYSVTMVMWENLEKRHFNSKNNTLSVTTIDGITYTFDITTGNIIDQKNSFDYNLVVNLVVSIIIICFLMLIGFHKVLFKKK